MITLSQRDHQNLLWVQFVLMRVLKGLHLELVGYRDRLILGVVKKVKVCILICFPHASKICMESNSEINLALFDLSALY